MTLVTQAIPIVSVVQIVEGVVWLTKLKWFKRLLVVTGAATLLYLASVGAVRLRDVVRDKIDQYYNEKYDPHF
jgi:hypothetical protein